jgi:PD-(D/E)XK endonuclease
MIAAEAIRSGVGVLKPLNDGLRYDLVLDVGRLVRVQCKWAVRRGDVVDVSCRTCRRGANGFIRSSYTANEVDLIGAYCLELDACYLIPIARLGGRSFMTLRLAHTRNNQRKAVNWAKDYEFAATLSQLVGP